MQHFILNTIFYGFWIFMGLAPVTALLNFAYGVRRWRRGESGVVKRFAVGVALMAAVGCGWFLVYQSRV